MFSFLRELFSPGSALGLHVGERSIAAVQVSNPFGSPAVERADVQEFADPDHAGTRLAAMIDGGDWDPEMVVTSIPASRTAIRDIPIELDNPKKLRPIIKYQMEPFSPHPIEEMLVDHLPVERGRPVTAVGVHKQILSEHLDVCRSGGVEPDRVSVDAVALYALCLHLGEGGGDRAAAVVHVDGPEGLVLVVDRNRLDLVRVLQWEEDPVERIHETLSLHRLKNPEARPGEILLTGRDGAAVGSAGRLAERTGLETRPWLPFDRVKHDLGAMDARQQGELAVPLGLALGASVAGVRGFDLRREEFALGTAADLKRPLVYTAVSLAVLAALLTFNTYHSLSTVKRDHERLSSEIRQVFLGTFPETQRVLKGREMEQMEQKLASETRQYRWLEEARERGPILEVLLILTRNLAGFREVELDNLAVEGRRVDLDGRAPSFQTVDNLKGVLERTGFFPQVRLVGAKMDSAGRGVRFNFVLERKK